MKHLLHLATRFFRSLRARRPTIADQEFVAAHLEGELARVFWRQPIPDLEHAVGGARLVARQRPARPELVRAFLLHDVGKRHSGLGTLRRSLATATSLARLPVSRAGRAYLDHGAIGADELALLGAEPVVIAFARHHHITAPPPGLSSDDWTALVSADRV